MRAPLPGQASGLCDLALPLNAAQSWAGSFACCLQSREDEGRGLAPGLGYQEAQSQFLATVAAVLDSRRSLMSGLGDVALFCLFVCFFGAWA